jgi:hypothetical protein
MFAPGFHRYWSIALLTHCPSWPCLALNSRNRALPLSGVDFRVV